MTGIAEHSHRRNRHRQPRAAETAQPDLLDALAEAERRRDEGMAATTEASDELAIHAVDQIIAHLNAVGRPWSANDMRDLLPEVRHPLIGARVRAAAMRRPVEMVKVGTTPSNLPSTHTKDIAVWRGCPDGVASA